MAKTSFAKAGGAAVLDDEPDTSAALATRESAPPASPYTDEYETQDIVIPRLNVAQKVGELGDIFEPGAVILNKEVVLPTPFLFVVVGALPKQFSEKIQGGALGRLLNSRQAVLDADGVFTKREAEATGKPLFQDLVTFDVLVERPAEFDDVSGLFSYEADGEFYAPARYTTKGSSYFSVGKKLLSAKAMGSLKGGWSNGVWEFLPPVLTTFGPNKVFVPQVKAAGATSNELVGLCNQFSGRAADATAAPDDGE